MEESGQFFILHGCFTMSNVRTNGWCAFFDCFPTMFEVFEGHEAIDNVQVRQWRKISACILESPSLLMSLLVVVGRSHWEYLLLLVLLHMLWCHNTCQIEERAGWFCLMVLLHVLHNDFLFNWCLVCQIFYCAICQSLSHKGSGRFSNFFLTKDILKYFFWIDSTSLRPWRYCTEDLSSYSSFAIASLVRNSKRYNAWCFFTCHLNQWMKQEWS